MVTSYLVIREIENGTKKHPKLQGILDANEAGEIDVIKELTDEEFITLGKLPKSLSEADRSCLAITEHRRLILISDDDKVIARAKEKGIAVKQTEDILKEAIENRLLTIKKANNILSDMEERASLKKFRRLR